MPAPYSDENPPNRPAGAPRRAEATSKKARGRAVVFMTIALVAGLAAAFLVTRQVAMRNAVVASIAKVAVAAKEIPRATTLRPELITFVDWPAHAVPKGAYTDKTLSELSGRVVAHALGAGEPLTETQLAPKGSGLGMAAVLPPNMRAMTMTVNEVIGVAGFIHPDDYVDVITTMSIDPSGRNDEIRAKIILQNVRVLAVGQEMVTQEAKPVKVSVVTLLVTPEQSERLTLATLQGKIMLTLRSRTDEVVTETTGVSAPELFGVARAVKKEEPKDESKNARRPAPAARPAAKPDTEVVEVLRGDKFEERKLRSSEGN
jgi:pilus assembly protein CpaB